MNIVYRPSGARSGQTTGRGEYETSGETVDGFTSKDVLDKDVIIVLGEHWRFHTSLKVLMSEKDKKPRFRRTIKDRKHIQIQRQISAALMLAPPVRSDDALEKNGGRLINSMTIDKVEIDESSVTFYLGKLIIKDSKATGEINIAERVANIEEIWRKASLLTPELSNLLMIHKSTMTSGKPVLSENEIIYKSLAETVKNVDAETRDLFEGSDDLLPPLQLLIGSSIIKPLFNVDNIPDEERLLRRRSVEAWRQWANINIRGASGRKFMEKVRRAHSSTCFICGVRFPPTNISPAGVDAAHILPWRHWELDDVKNGICLCKTHHWAFDSRLITINWSEERYLYYTEFPEIARSRLIELGDNFSVSALESVVGDIPTNRLPQDPAEWPEREYLAVLNSVQQQE
jgi:HNH endonuclease